MRRCSGRRARFAWTPDLSAANSNTTRTVVRQIAFRRPTYFRAVKTISRDTSVKFTSAGSWYVRSIANPTPYNANSVWSPHERYNVN